MSRRTHRYRRRPSWALDICCPRCRRRMGILASRMTSPEPGLLPTIENLYHCGRCDLVWYIPCSVAEPFSTSVLINYYLPVWADLGHEDSCDDPTCRFWVSEGLRKLLMVSSL